MIYQYWTCLSSWRKLLGEFGDCNEYRGGKATQKADLTMYRLIQDSSALGRLWWINTGQVIKSHPYKKQPSDVVVLALPFGCNTILSVCKVSCLRHYFTSGKTHFEHPWTVSFQLFHGNRICKENDSFAHELNCYRYQKSNWRPKEKKPSKNHKQQNQGHF